MMTQPDVPFTVPELSIRWARRTYRACRLLMRIVHPDVAMPLVEELARAARELLDGAAVDATTCHDLAVRTWELTDRSWERLTDDPIGARRRLFRPYAEASAVAGCDWLRAVSLSLAR